MIRTQQEYENACEFIDSDMELYDFKLSDRMSSYEYNLYLQDTEYFLNFLYEKVRTLEELCDYLDTYTTTKIGKAREEVAKSKKKLQETIVRTERKDRTICLPEWDKGTTILDRDGSSLSFVTEESGILEGAARNVNKVYPTAIQRIDTNKIYAEKTDKQSCLISCKEDTVTFPEVCIRIAMPQGKSYDTISYDPINAEIQAEKENETDIIFTIWPLSYKKEKQKLRYKDYYSNEQMCPTNYRYDSVSVQLTNEQNMTQLRNSLNQDQYYKDVITVQDIAKEQAKKAEIAQL